VLQLESQLAATQQAAAAREEELHDTIEVLRRDKRDLEARAAGMSIDAMEQGDALVSQARAARAPALGCLWTIGAQALHMVPLDSCGR
jgi:hypothetical protein